MRNTQLSNGNHLVDDQTGPSIYSNGIYQVSHLSVYTQLSSQLQACSMKYAVSKSTVTNGKQTEYSKRMQGPHFP